MEKYSTLAKQTDSMNSMVRKSCHRHITGFKRRQKLRTTRTSVFNDLIQRNANITTSTQLKNNRIFTIRIRKLKSHQLRNRCMKNANAIVTCGYLLSL